MKYLHFAHNCLLIMLFVVTEMKHEAFLKLIYIQNCYIQTEGAQIFQSFTDTLILVFF